MEGRVSSVQSMGAVDGPGLRYVVFLQGCPLRCAYCHNPETWDLTGGHALHGRGSLQNNPPLPPLFRRKWRCHRLGRRTAFAARVRRGIIPAPARTQHPHRARYRRRGDLSVPSRFSSTQTSSFATSSSPQKRSTKPTAAAPCSTRSISCALRNRCIFPFGCATSSRPVFPIRLRAFAPSKLSRSRSPIWRKSSGCRLKTSAPPNTRRFISRSPWATNPRSHKAMSKRSFQSYNFIQKGCPALCRAAFSFSSLFPFWFRFIHFLKNSQF